MSKWWWVSRNRAAATDSYYHLWTEEPTCEKGQDGTIYYRNPNGHSLGSQCAAIFELETGITLDPGECRRIANPFYAAAKLEKLKG
jgi:hypothetical protein